MPQIILKQRVSRDDPLKICDALAHWSGLSKIRVKTAMASGAVWLQRSRGKRVRVRRASASVHIGDLLCLYYDEAILTQVPPKAKCVRDFGRYSVWFKPAGLLTQGTKFGDHCSLLRQVELHFGRKRTVLPVHRLDREALGLVLFAHDRKTAADFSMLLRNRSVQKYYQIHVRGNLAAFRGQGEINFPLDGRPARTRYDTLCYNAQLDQSVVRVLLLSGRFHQIRRHFHLLGFPVVGDPRYGTLNKNREGMRLVAYRLAFTCPIHRKYTEVSVDPESIL